MENQKQTKIKSQSAETTLGDVPFEELWTRAEGGDKAAFGEIKRRSEEYWRSLNDEWSENRNRQL